MKRITHIVLLSLLIISGNVNAQFAKPLPNKQDPWAEAQYSIGVIGGISATHWIHLGGTNTDYEQPITTIAFDSTFLTSTLNNALAGITVQKKLGDYHAVGLEVMYANRSTTLDNHYTISYSLDNDSTIFNYNTIQYSELLVQIPITQYFNNSAKKIRPYLFVAPRVTIPLNGTIAQEKMVFPITENESPLFPQNGDQPNNIDDTPIDTSSFAFSNRNMRSWNIGAVVGLGIQFRIPVGSYYFTTKLDASCYMGLLNTYSKYERGKVVKKDYKGNDVLDANGNPVLDLPINFNTGKPIDLGLLGTRYISNATVKLTLLFPIKKLQKDACVSWGEYD